MASSLRFLINRILPDDRSLITHSQLVLLSATVTLLYQPHLDPGHLIAPGAGTLAVLQGITPARATLPAALAKRAPVYAGLSAAAWPAQ
jgi:hypothetical protein